MCKIFKMMLILLIGICGVAFAQGNDVLLPKMVHLASPSLTSPQNNLSVNLTKIDLSWKQVANASYYVVQVTAGSNQFTGNDVKSYDVFKKQSYTLDNLTTGQYYWRVKSMPGLIQNDFITTVFNLAFYVESDWSATRTFTIKDTQITDPGVPDVKPVILAVPQLLSPANGAYSVPVTTNLTWKSTNTQGTYNIQISTDVKFVNGLSEVTGLTTASYTPQNILENTQYYWRVKAIAPTTSTGLVLISAATTTQPVIQDSAWSQVWAFNTTGKTIVKMKVPEKIAPTAGATTSYAPELSWNSVDGARYYTVQVAKDPSFNTITFGSGLISATSLTLPTQKPGATLYWRVRAIGDGSVTEWTTISSFVIETLQVADGLELKVRAKIADQGDSTVSSTVATNRTTSYYVSIKNISNRAVTLLITATGGQTGWNVNYFDGFGKLITKQVVNDTGNSSYSISLPAFGRNCMRVDVTPASGANATTAQITNIITATFADNSTISASVTMITNKK